MSEKITIAESIVNYLERSGIKHAFGFPGETTLPIYVAYNHSKINHIMAGCERCAGYMADTYSRITNTIGIVDAPGGIGTPWLVPAIVEAKNSSIPLFVITSGVKDSATGAFNQCPMFSHITNQTLALENPYKISESIRNLFVSALGQKLGPVFFEIPTDMLQSSLVENNSEEKSDINYPQKRIVPEEKDIQAVINAIKTANHPIILAGGGIWLSLANRELALFSSQFKIPVATTINGKGAINENSEWCLGVVGNKGSKEANNFFKKSDLIIIIGSKCGDKSTDKGRLLLGKQIIRVDPNPNLINNNDGMILLCDAREFLFALCQFDLQRTIEINILEEISKVKKQIKDKFLEFEREELAVSPSFIIKSINNIYSGEAIICADASVASGWAGALGFSNGEFRNIITPRGTGSLGFGLPATIGAKIASPDKQIFGIGGDAGFAMSCHEIETACRLGLNFSYFILKNNALGLLENHLEQVMYQNIHILRKRYNTDWEMLARAFGANSFSLRTNSEVMDYLKSPPNGTNIVQVYINQNILTPDFETTL